MIENLKTHLDLLAESIRQKVNHIESKRQDEIAIDDEIQLIKVTGLAHVSTDRDEHGKLRHTNDDQRRSALLIALNANQDYQNLKSARAVKIVERVLLESEVEFQRKSFRALELQMLHYANHNGE
jgi:urate oxidase